MLNKVFTYETKGLTWLDIINPTHEELQGVADEFGLHATSLEDCLDPRHQPKFERVGNVVFIIVRAYDEGCNPKTDNILELTRKVAIFVGDRFILTVHRCDLRFVQELREKWQSKGGIRPDQTLLLFDLLKAVILSFAPALDQLEQTVDDFEERLFSNEDTPVIIREVHWFRSRVSAIRTIFRQSYDVILKIDDYADPVAPLYQDIRERLERYLNLTDALREAGNDILNTHISLASHRTNEVIRVLTIFSVFFLPLTFIVGVYGMNFEYMPELKWVYGYPGTWLVMLAVTVGIFIWFKRRGWLK